MSPSGKHLMDAFFAAGGLPALLAEIRDLLHLDCLTVTGRTLGESLENARSFDRDVIRPRAEPLLAGGSLAVVRGNLAPCGAVIKTSAATPGPAQTPGQEPSCSRTTKTCSPGSTIPALPVDRDSVLVLRNAGPKGVPGFPEWGMIPVPTKLLQQGVTDMVRISDSRMSGTSYGTVVIHISPEAAAGGPLGPRPKRRLHRTRRAPQPVGTVDRLGRTGTPPPSRGGRRPRRIAAAFRGSISTTCLQAHEGADFDFLRPRSDEDLDFIEPTVGRS